MGQNGWYSIAGAAYVAIMLGIKVRTGLRNRHRSAAIETREQPAYVLGIAVESTIESSAAA